MSKTPTATATDVWYWLRAGVFTVAVCEATGEAIVYKGDRELTSRINTRHRNLDDEHGDPRVDLWHESKRRSCHVSHIVWQVHAERKLPSGFEIHHRNGNPLDNRFDNLLCVHPRDHIKLHGQPVADGEFNDDTIPF